MRKEFEALKLVLFVGNTHDPNGNDNWSEVTTLLSNLEKKIDEVEKRIECSIRSAQEANDSISLYTQRVDNNETFQMDVRDHDSILRGTNDVLIALDMKDTECVEHNWYNLFQSKEVNENEETYPIVNCLDCGYPQPLLEENVHVDSMGRHMVCESCEGSFNVGGDVFMTFESSWGEIDCDRGGKVIEIRADEYFNGERNYMYDIEKFDLVEYGKFLESKNITHGECDDILTVGFWKKDGEYAEPDHAWRGEIFPPTMQCRDSETFDKVKQVINILKTLDNGDCVDGETMEYILKQVGMQDQMLKQLFAQTTNDEIDYLHDVRNGKG